MPDFAGAGVAGHDDDGVLEVDLSAVTVGQDTVVQNLQKQVVDVGVGLLNFVQKHHAVGALADLFAELAAAFLEAHVSRRRSDEATDAVLFHVFAHVDTDHGIFATEEGKAKHLRKFRLAHAGGTQEQEAPHGALGVADACAGATNCLDHGVHRLVLTDDTLLDFVAQVQKFLGFFACEAAYGNARHLADAVPDGVFVHHGNGFGFLVSGQGVATFHHLLFQFFGLVPEGGGGLEILVGHGVVQLPLGFCQFVFQVLQVLRNADGIQTHAGSGFVQHVDGLVRQETFTDVAFCQQDRRPDGVRCVTDLVVGFVLGTEPVQNLDGIFGVGRIHHDGLETAFQGRVLLDILAVFVDGGGTDALELASGQRRLENVGGVQAAFGAARAYDGVEFVDKEDNGTVHTLEFHDEALHTFLELAAVLGARHHGGNVQSHHTLVHEEFGNFLLDYLLGQAFDDGGLAYARLADKGGIVLLAAAKDLDKPFDFLLAADDGVQLALAGQGRQVTAEMVQDRRLGLGAGTPLGAALSRARNGFVGLVVGTAPLELIQGLLKALESHVIGRKGGRRRRIALLEYGKHQVFGTDILVTFFFCNLCGVEHDRLGAGGKGQEASAVVAADSHEAAVVGEGPLDNLPQFRKVHLQGLQSLGGIARIFADKPQKKMFHRNAVASQVSGRHTGRLEDRLCLCRKNTVILRHIVNYEFGVRNSELDF